MWGTEGPVLVFTFRANSALIKNNSDSTYLLESVYSVLFENMILKPQCLANIYFAAYSAL